MEPFKFHVYICAEKKPDFIPSCPGAGGAETLAALKKEIAASGLSDEVQVTTCGCLGLCGKGPNLIVYPEGAWYSGIGPDEAREIARSHLKGGKPVDRLLIKDPASARDEIVRHGKFVAAMKEMMAKGGALPDEINEFMRGFMESRAVLTAIELDLFTAIGDGATAAEAATKTGASERGTDLLLHALCAMKVLNKDGETFRNSALTEKYFREGGEFDSRMAAMHVVQLWPRWSTLTDCVKEGTSVAIRSGEERGEESTRAFIAAMHKNAAFRAEKMVGLLDLAGVNKVLDLGGGSGAYAIAFAKLKPGAKVAVFDLPTVTLLTEGYIAEAGLSGKIEVISGDMLKDGYGDGYDLVFVSAICHMWSRDENLVMLGKIRGALNPGGRVILQDFVLDDDRTGPRFGAIFALNMLVNTRGGSSYSRREYFDWLEEAGFTGPELKPLPGPTGLVVARKP